MVFFYENCKMAAKFIKQILFFAHGGCQLDGEAEFKYMQQKCIKQIASIDIIIIHCNKRLVGLIVQPFIFI